MAKVMFTRDLYLLCRNSTNVTLKIHYRQYSKILKDVIKEAKKQYYTKQIINSINKVKTTWNITKSVTGRSVKIDTIQELNINGNTVSNSQDIADHLNKFFSLVTGDNTTGFIKTDIGPLDYLQQTFHHPFPYIKFHAITSAELAKIINSLKSKGSYGYDAVSVKLLKLSSPCIISPLTYTGNKMLDSGIFPDRLKFAEIKPLCKGGDRKPPANYRPISLLTSFSKIFEKIISSRLNQHIYDNNILMDEQFGFRHQSSTTEASFKLYNEILEALNKKKHGWQVLL
jgi:hypothetical protein